MRRIETHATPFPCMVNMAKKDSGKALFKCHFRNTLCLCFKMSPNLCKTFHMKMSLICMKMNLWVDTFSYKINGFAKTRFDTEAKATQVPSALLPRNLKTQLYFYG